MDNGSMSNTGPLISPATSFNKLALSKQQFDKRRKVIIGNLPDILDVKEFKEKLLQGYVADDVKCEKNAVTILFNKADQAATAVKALNNQPFNGYPIKAEYAQPDSLLFVGNLPFDFSEEQFVALMSQYGPVDRIFLVRSEVTGESKGYGFVEYPNRELAAQSKQSLMNTDSKYIGGRILRVDFAEPNLSSYMDLHSKTLFVDKLPRDFTNGEVLRDIFSRTGTVTFAQVAVNHQTGASRGFAFVDYATSDDAERGQIAHNGAQIEGSNIRVAYGTPGRTGASILGLQSTNTTQVVNQIPLIQAGTANIRAIVPQWTAQPAAPHPLMARPLMANSVQNSEVRGPAPRFQAPLIAQAGTPAQVCSPRAALLVRPLTRETNTRMGGPPQRPIMAGPQVRGPHPLMADFSIRVPDPRQVGPRGFSPRVIAATSDPRCAVFRNGPVRPLMSLNSNKNSFVPEESLEANQSFVPQMEQTPPGTIGRQPVNQFQPQQQQLQALMQSPVQQQQQQQLVTPQPQLIPQPLPQPLPQPSPQNFRPAEAQAPPAMAPQPLPLAGPNVGGQKGGRIEGPAVPGVEGGFSVHSQQAPAPGSVVLLGPGNSQQSEYQIPRPVSGPGPQQGLQIRPPAAAAFQTSQSPVKTFLPPPAADQMPVRPPGPTPLMAATNHIVPGGQPRPPFTNETQNIPSLPPAGQAAPVQFGVPSSQTMAPPQPLMQLPDQTPPHVSVAQRPAVVPSQQDPTMQYQNYGFQQQVPTVEHAGTPFMAGQVRPPPPPQQQTGPTLQPGHESTRVVQGVQHQLPVQQQPPVYPNQMAQQQLFQQGPMAPATDAQWMHPVGNAQQPVPLMSVQSFQVPPIQEQQVPPHDNSTQQWRPAQLPMVQLQPGYGQFQQEPQQQMFTPAQQFPPLAQPPDPSYQQQQQLQIASNTSTPSPIPQHSAAPVMYNTQTTPNEPNQHGQKRPPDHQLSDQSYVNQPRPLLGIGEFYDANKRPRF